MDDYIWSLSECWAELRSEPAFTVSEWADEHRVLSSEASAEAGPWRTSRTPYLREIMDCLSSYSSVETVAVMKGAQIGMSETALNALGYFIHHAPGPILYVLPTIAVVEKFSRTRLDPMIDASPALLERIPKARSRDSVNSVASKKFPGGVVFFAGANSAASLRSMPIRYLLLDEVDSYPMSADDEGDPVNLAIKRTAAFFRRKVFMLSTPKLKDISRIGKAFRDGDQRFYMVTCDGCGVEQPIVWKQIKWPKGDPEKASFHCAHCDHAHSEHRKMGMLQRGVWRPTAESKQPGYRSYHLSSLYSPWQSWAACAREFLDCHGQDGKADPALLQVFVNTVLGEEWDEPGERVSTDGLLDLREDWGPLLPDRVAVLTAGVDVQPDRLEVEIVGWGADEESWSVDHRVIVGDPEQDDVWLQLDKLRDEKFTHPGYREGLRIQATCVDTGGSNTARVYAYCSKHIAEKVWAIKGSNTYSAPIWPKKPSRTKKSGTNFYMVGVSAAKGTIYRRLKRTGPNEKGAGVCHFGMHNDQEYFNQLTAEVVRTKFVNGFPTKFWWKPEGKRNEALDIRVYALAALQSLIALGLKLNTQAMIVAARVIELARANAETPEPMPVATPSTENVKTELAEPAEPVARRPPRLPQKAKRRFKRSGYV